MNRLLLIQSLIALAFSLPHWAHAAPQADSQAAKKVLIITNRGCEEVCQSFKSNLEHQGPVSFTVKDVGGDISRVAEIVKDARKARPDLVATWGTGITQAVIGKLGAVDPVQHLTDIPVVYMYVGNPVTALIAKDAGKSGRPNVAGANTSVPIDAQVNLLKSFSKIQRVAMLYNTDEPSAVGQVADVEKGLKAASIEVSKIEFPLGPDGRPSPSDIGPMLDKLALQKPDFVFQIGSTFVQKNIEAISKGTTERGLPMFSAFESAFRKGEILLALVSPLNGVGQIAAYQAGQILFHGRAPDSLPSPTLSRYSVLINMKPARALQIYPPMKLLQFAEVTR
jgi:putative ABC transport system substrate-binding protein